MEESEAEGGRGSLAMWKNGRRNVRVYFARGSSKDGNSKSFVLMNVSGEGTLWDSALLASLTVWDVPVLLCTPISPLPEFSLTEKRGGVLVRAGRGASAGWGVNF